MSKGNRKIQNIAERILEDNPDPAIQVRLLRDILGKNRNDAELIEAESRLNENKWVQILRNDQWEDGSWGRFHTEDTTLKQRVPTTEVGVSRSVNLGLNETHPIIQKVTYYIVGILNRSIKPRDVVPKGIGQSFWDHSINKIVAASLAEINPNHPILNDYFDLWARIIQESFPNNSYNAQNQIFAFLEILKINYDDFSTRFKKRIKEKKELTINNVYSVNLIGSQIYKLNPDLEKAFFRFIWNLGIGYLNVDLRSSPSDLIGTNSFTRWLRSLEVLKPYPSWRTNVEEIFEWFWDNQTKCGLWDFGKVPLTNRSIRLSSSWRKPDARIHDWTTRILLILK
ncbi:MAG: hypothetical protein JSW11_20720 [Candidatus Heimdallarchaeota archaeon]|nr:MAG: hypothetical protein JSW11_20720 [Candidatus Heimdallarchaeota archaeon]